MATESSLRNLQQIKHIVVLMQENRSFDQMLGYLDGEGLDVDGLSGAEPNLDAAGNEYAPFTWAAGETAPQPPPGQTAKILDPCHSPGCVQAQLADGNRGFVKDFEKTRVDADGNDVALGPDFLKVPMGHYNGDHLPVYDLLARRYCVCDAWHSSIPGNTWPNRLYAMAGREDEPVSHRPGLLERLVKRFGNLPGIGQLANAPIYDVTAFTHQLRQEQWRWYSHDPATLRCADSAYRDFRRLNRDNFAYFDRKKMSVLTKTLEAAVVELHDSFLDDAAKGQLRQVSWIDPNFVDLKVLDPNSNDDHPPADVQAGQALVLETYEALVNSRDWADTLLIVVYDEHGGFYDHVAPPPVEPGDPSQYSTLGLRVPAIVIGPRVENGVCKRVFDHTTLISTILRCFAEDVEKAIGAMPRRVGRAAHLGDVLEAEPRVEAMDMATLRKEIAAAREKLDAQRKVARERRRGRDGSPSPEADGGAGRRQDLHDWQEEFLGFALTMRDAGLPPGHP